MTGQVWGWGWAVALAVLALCPRSLCGLCGLGPHVLGLPVLPLLGVGDAARGLGITRAGVLLLLMHVPFSGQ